MDCYDGPLNEKQKHMQFFKSDESEKFKKIMIILFCFFFVTTIFFKYFESTKQQWLSAIIMVLLLKHLQMYKSDGKYCIYNYTAQCMK